MRKRNNLVYGIGVNDADYMVQTTVDGKQQRCPYYSTWYNMLGRCYSAKLQEIRPTYKGCTVCDEWLSFMAFRKWMQSQDWQGKQIDKDIMVPGNKLYSPETCVFVTRQVNSLLTDSGAARGEFPQGVSWRKQNQKYVAQIAINGKRKPLGLFSTPEEAAAVYNKAKSDHIREKAYYELDNRVVHGLLQHAKLFDAVTISN